MKGLWPRTVNPHLRITRVTADDQTRPPVAHTVMEAIFDPLRLSPGQLRRDRILDEASHTADPVHLMHVFGISAKTAMTYAAAAALAVAGRSAPGSMTMPLPSKVSTSGQAAGAGSITRHR